MCEWCTQWVFLKILVIFVKNFLDIGIAFALLVRQKLKKCEYKNAMILSEKLLFLWQNGFFGTTIFLISCLSSWNVS